MGIIGSTGTIGIIGTIESTGTIGSIEIRRPRSAGRAPGKPSVPFLGTFRESGELLCRQRVLVLPQHSSKVRT